MATAAAQKRDLPSIFLASVDNYVTQPKNNSIFKSNLAEFPQFFVALFGLNSTRVLPLSFLFQSQLDRIRSGKT